MLYYYRVHGLLWDCKAPLLRQYHCEPKTSSYILKKIGFINITPYSRIHVEKQIVAHVAIKYLSFYGIPMTLT
jgi:hypothetical protein